MNFIDFNQRLKRILSKVTTFSFSLLQDNLIDLRGNSPAPDSRECMNVCNTIINVISVTDCNTVISMLNNNRTL